MEAYDIYIYIIGYIGLACWGLLGVKVAARIIAREVKKELKKN